MTEGSVSRTEAGLERAELAVRPRLEDFLDGWRLIVNAEREQVESLPNRPTPEDFYAPVAQNFRPAATQDLDPALDEILKLVQRDDTWLDLGAGGGRYAIPLAQRAARVFAIEPSAGMRATLAEAVGELGVANIDVFAERWPEPSAAPVADMSLISHVAYDITDIGPFLDEMEAHTRRTCVAILFDGSPTAYFAPLWLAVHGQKRILLPGLADFVRLLVSRGAFPSVTALSLPGRVFNDVEALHRVARRPLWVREGSAEDMRLLAAIEDAVVPVEGGVSLGEKTRTLGVVTWQPSSSIRKSRV